METDGEKTGGLFTYPFSGAGVTARQCVCPGGLGNVRHTAVDLLFCSSADFSAVFPPCAAGADSLSSFVWLLTTDAAGDFFIKLRFFYMF